MARGKSLTRSVTPDKAGRGKGDRAGRTPETTIRAYLYLKESGESPSVSSETVGDMMGLVLGEDFSGSQWRKARGDPGANQARSCFAERAGQR